ncbi:MarR family winged helix-turn-helix transcriptional regulator [Nocardia stercoris]|uniref:MarR family transcriptional regulator n=1 Tax=Nocardia stercoris TaxID=2483361 RepID=A0A3M2L3Q1_9NOCA|nr:MarR family transcriptional regulator [Nocardia stercoris]RMI29138.1 MarR family transcriptional regulator [Nocardia stercoris]
MNTGSSVTSRRAAIQSIQRELTAFSRRARGRAAELYPLLSLVSASILDLVIERDGCLSVDIAEHFALDKSTVSRQVAALEKLGYLVREVDPANRRNYTLRATPAGRQAAKEAEQARLTAFTDHLHRWDDADIATFAAYLMRFNAS